MNLHSFEYQALKREAEGDKKVYDELMRKIKEAGINASFQNSAIRIADAARPGLQPVFPRVGLNLLLALLLSTVLAAGAALVSDSLDKTVRDPELAARLLNVPVIGSLPLVRNWRTALSLIPVNENASGGGLALARLDDDPWASPYREAVRTLRNSIFLVDFDRRIQSLLITSASPGEGKSTVASHLAVTHAAHRQRTLLIDGDLRRPSLHKRFQVSGAMGLSTVLLSGMPWRDAVLKPAGMTALDILPAGPPSHRAAGLLGQSLAQLLDEAAAEYDLVILDAAPLLGFADPLEMAAAVDGVVVVARAGQTTRKAVAGVLAALTRLRANTLGIVLNEVRQDTSESYSYYSHYAKYYGARGKRAVKGG